MVFLEVGGLAACDGGKTTTLVRAVEEETRVADRGGVSCGITGCVPAAFLDRSPFGRPFCWSFFWEAVEPPDEALVSALITQPPVARGKNGEGHSGWCYHSCGLFGDGKLIKPLPVAC